MRGAMTAKPPGLDLFEKEYAPRGGGTALEYFNDWVRAFARE
jgi:hypothetical protein